MQSRLVLHGSLGSRAHMYCITSEQLGEEARIHGKVRTNLEQIMRIGRRKEKREREREAKERERATTVGIGGGTKEEGSDVNKGRACKGEQRTTQKKGGMITFPFQTPARYRSPLRSLLAMNISIHSLAARAPLSIPVGYIRFF